MAEDYAAIFKEEAAELLEELEKGLLELEENPEDLKIVGGIFRAMHTIKGSGAMFGFDEISNFTHNVETVLDKVRDGVLPVSKELIDLVLASRDHISSMLAATTNEGDYDVEDGEKIIRSLQALLDGNPGSRDVKGSEQSIPDAEPILADQASSVDSGGEQAFYRINFHPLPEFFKEDGDVDTLLAELAQLGELEVTGQSNGTSGQYAAGKIEAFWDILLLTTVPKNTIRDIFIFVENICDVKVTKVGSATNGVLTEPKKLGEILVDRGEVSEDVLDKVLNEQKPIGQMLVDKKVVSSEKVDSALKEQKILCNKPRQSAKGVESLRVGADKLDHLVNLVGEMVVTQARLTQAASGGGAGLLEPVEEVERITAELRDCVLNIRMLPIGSSFSKFKRLVRDLSAELGKEVELVMEGAETELDKSVIELMGEPFVHIIRNSIDHGIESPEERVELGKTRKGTIKLSARHSGANVVVQVIDDGKGLDAAEIRKKAIEKDFIAADSELEDDEIFDLIFGAGVSTASKVTDVSGRGVGMDVVKTTIEGRLNGSVHVASEKHVGTTITITLPLTLAIIDGLLVRVGDTHFVVPLSQVEECVELTAADIERFHGRRLYPIRDQLISYVNLRSFFMISGEPPPIQQMVTVSVNEEQFGLVLDDVVGDYQTVIKSLGWAYRSAEGVSGATILGNGEVALVVDVAGLVKHARKDEFAS